MNILLIAENWSPGVGGIQRYLAGITEGLAKLPGVEITVIVPTGSTFPKIKGVTFLPQRFYWPILKPAWLPLYMAVTKLVKKESFDVVLCGKALFEGLLGHYIKKKTGTPFMVFTYAMEINTWAARASTRKKLSRVLQNADGIIAINKQIAQKIEDLGADKTAIHIIYPAIDESFGKAVAQARENRATLQKYDISKPYILTVCRLIERKGVDDVIRAFAKLDQTKFPDVQLVIAGDGPARLALEKTAEQEYVRPLFLGEIPDEDLPGLFAHADVFVLPPKQIGEDIEGFGIVYLEAAAAGLPIIASKSGGVPEAITQAGGGVMVEPGNPDEIAVALAKTLEKEPAAKPSSPTLSSWEERAKQLIKLLPDR